ncbi:hypothetical protein DIRU0_E30702 [Diutina rugosa]
MTSMVIRAFGHEWFLPLRSIEIDDTTRRALIQRHSNFSIDTKSHYFFRFKGKDFRDGYEQNPTALHS